MLSVISRYSRNFRRASTSSLVSRNNKHKIAPIKRAETEKVSFKSMLKNASFESEAKIEEEAGKFLDLAAGKLYSATNKSNNGIIDWKMAAEIVAEAERHFPLPRKYSAKELNDLKKSSLSFNASKLVNDSFSAKKMVDLGIDLGYWEEQGESGT